MLVIAGLPLLIGFYQSLSPETVALSRTLVLIHSVALWFCGRRPLCFPMLCGRPVMCGLP